jgi:uncharacterized protein YraI
MMRLRHVLVILVVLGLILNIPMMSLAQDSSVVPNQTQPQQPSRQAPPQLVGGVGTVIGVDQPENCLKVRSGPGSSYDVIGCVLMGTELNLTGIWTSNDWVQLTGDGWVYGPQISTDLRPPQETLSQSATYAYEYYPIEDYSSLDWDYLPDYGYATYWYGGIPIIVYNSGVWWRHHPWWWWSRHHAHDPNRNWMWNRATGINRNLIANRSNLNRAFNQLNSNRALNQANLNRVLNQSNTSRNFNQANLSGTLNQSNLNRTFGSNQSNVLRNQSNWNRNFLRTQPNLNRSFGATNRSNISNFNLNRSFNRANTARSFSSVRSPNLGSFALRSPSITGIHISSSPHVSTGGTNLGRGTIRHR